jgi:hypothetical protein
MQRNLIFQIPNVLSITQRVDLWALLYFRSAAVEELSTRTGVCDANNLFTNIVAHYAGSTHDAHIWNNCKLHVSEAFESGVIKNGWLLGTSFSKFQMFFL